MQSTTAIAKIWVFRGLIAPKLYILHQNWCTKGTSFGCRLAPEMLPIPIAKTLPSELYPVHKHPHFYLFWGPGKPLHRNSETFHQCMHADTDSRLFQKWSKSMHYKWPKGRVALVTEKNKTRFGTLRRNPWGNFRHFSCVSAYHGIGPSLIVQVSSR